MSGASVRNSGTTIADFVYAGARTPRARLSKTFNEENQAMKKLDEMDKEFGAFYPRGHMVVEFAAEQNAKLVLVNLKAHQPSLNNWLKTSF